VVQALTEPDARWGCVMDCRCDKFAAAEFEESSVADAMKRAPGQNAHRVAFGYPFSENLARLVPVDEEHQRCAEILEKGVAAGAVVERQTSGDEIEGAVVAEAGRAFAFKPAPQNGKIAEQPDKELCTREMHVGIRNDDRFRLNGNHHDVGIGLADIVLNRKPTARSRRGRGQAGMPELQFLRCLDPPHEGFDRGPIVRQKSVNVRAGECFLRIGSGEPVEGFVQVHHQAMKAVIVAAEAGQLGNLPKLDIIGRANGSQRPDR